MPLHIFRVDGPNRLRSKPVAMSFELLQKVQPALEAFRKVTGTRISEYDDAKLSPEQLGVLLNLILSTHPEMKENEEIQVLLSLVKNKSSDSYFVAQGE